MELISELSFVFSASIYFLTYQFTKIHIRRNKYRGGKRFLRRMNNIAIGIMMAEIMLFNFFIFTNLFLVGVSIFYILLNFNIVVTVSLKRRFPFVRIGIEKNKMKYWLKKWATDPFQIPVLEIPDE